MQFLNPAAFAPNPLGTFGNLGRNAVRGPNTVNFDVALSRMFKLTERFSLQARADAFNVFNHTNFVGAISPAGTVTGYSTLSHQRKRFDVRKSAGRLRSAHSAVRDEAVFLEEVLDVLRQQVHFDVGE